MKKLLVLLIAVPLLAGGKLWFNIGYGSSNQQYDKDGKIQDLGGKASVLNLYFGGCYHFLKLPAIELLGGADLRLSQHTFDPDQGESRSSDFSLQNLVLFFGAKGLFFKGKLGFLMDLGPEPKDNKINNSDEQHAIMINLTGTLPNPMFSLSAGLSYFLTLETEKKVFVFPEFKNVKADDGDFFAFFAKGGYKFIIGEAGLELIYRLRTSAKREGKEVKDSDGNHLSIIPYASISLPTIPIRFFLKGAIVDEYLPYGFSIMGKNDYVTRFALTFGGEFRF